MFSNLFKSDSEDNSQETTSEGGKIFLPVLGERMSSANISKWHVKKGDVIKKGQLIAEVETKKATFELESYFDGEVTHINPESTIKVNELIVIIGEEPDLEEISNTENTPPNFSEVGTIKLFAGDNIPTNWMQCSGVQLNKNEYPDLFSVIGYKYGGSGDSFHLPYLDDMKGVHYIICTKDLY